MAQAQANAGNEPEEPTAREQLARVLWEEMDEVFVSRKARGVRTGRGEPYQPSNQDPTLADACARAHKSQLVGLAFSGGGIRSATFNLGVLQGMARFGILRRLDFVSTVSGGGYIGSWLAGCLKRGPTSMPKKKGGAADVEKETEEEKEQETPTDGAKRFKTLERILGGERLEDGQEHTILHHLREYSNYLTPHVGLFSADTAQAVAAWLRNALLNQLILVLALGALLAVPLWVEKLYLGAVDSGVWVNPLLLILLSFTLAVSVIAFNISSLYGEGGRGQFSRPWSVNALAVAPFLVACWLAGMILYMHRDQDIWSWNGRLLFATLVGYFGMWLVAPWPAGAFKPEREGQKWFDLQFGVNLRLWRLLAGWSIPAGLVGGGLLLLISRAMRGSVDPVVAFCFAGPLVAVVFIATLWFHVGLCGRGLREEAREWSARLVGTLGLWTLGITALCVVSLYGSDIVGGISSWLRGVLTVGWLGTTLAGVVMGRRPEAPKGSMRFVVAAAPYVFIVGLVLLLAKGVSGLVELEFLTTVAAWASANGASKAVAGALPAFLCTALGVLLAVFLSWRIDVNLFSLHALYRNRLVRCYLGASNTDRKPNRWTDIDPDDERLAVSELRAGSDYAGPYPILNTTLNLVATEHLAWQKRKGASFIFAPLYSGFHPPPEMTEEPESRWAPLVPSGYRPTEQYADEKRSSLALRLPGVGLGTAMAISGAAASPNMGSGTQTPLAILMTIFNVRLGWWLGNPRREGQWRKSTPSIGLLQLVREMLGRTRQTDPYVYLSDGGHFENLGIYELVRRRCRFIIACDAEQDSDLEFGGLGTAIELCRTDFGIEIDIDVDALRRKAQDGNSTWHCAIGRIRYDGRDEGGEPGTLVYVKASLTGAEPTDVQRYAAKQSAFPHQSTADQWFDETQFESYRALGQHVAQTVFTPALPTSGKLGTKLSETEMFFRDLRERWFPPSSRVEAAFGREMAALSRIVDTIRSDPKLDFLEAQFYPEWNTLRNSPRSADKALPTDPEKLRAGFYVCSQLIQLMESVYLDLDLEREWGHPDTRGWMNLFRHWAWSSMFRVTWAVGASTYGARFQDWCDRILHMKLGAVDAQSLLRGVETPGHWVAGDRAEERLSFIERDLVPRILLELEGLEPRVSDIVGFDLVVEDPTATHADPGVAELERFPIGFAVLGGDTLYYFRMQDHMRQTGLGREALRALQGSRGNRVTLAGRKARDRIAQAKLREPVNPRERAAFENMFESVRFEIGG